MREPDPKGRTAGSAARQNGGRGIVQERAPVERAPVERAPDTGSRGQEFRGNRGGDDGGRGYDRGGDREAVETGAAVETGVAVDEGAERTCQREGSFSRIGGRGGGGFAGE